MKFITRFLLSVLSLLVISELLSGVTVSSLYAALVTVVVLSILNAVVRPILVVLTLPISILTLGLFTFVINAGLFMFAASFLEGFSVSGFWVALLASLIMSVVNVIGSKLAA